MKNNGLWFIKIMNILMWKEIFLVFFGMMEMSVGVKSVMMIYSNIRDLCCWKIISLL